MLKKDGTFEQDIQCIVQPINNRGAIYISNLQAASNPLTLQKYSIEAVVTAAKGKNLANIMPSHIQYLYIPAIDHQTFNLSQYFDVFNQFMDEQLRRTNILVHCMAGVSRSATLVISYLMRTRQLSYLQAYTYVKSKRKIISPNSSFICQLQKYEKKLRQSKQKMAESSSTTSSWYSVNSKQDSKLVTQKKMIDNMRDIQKLKQMIYLTKEKHQFKELIVNPDFFIIQMKKIYLGSTKVKCHFKMFRIKYNHFSEVERIRSGVMELMSAYLQKYDGKLINVKQLSTCKQLLVYFVTGEEAPHSNWDQYLQNNLLKQYNILPSSIQIGPCPQ